MIGSGSVNKLVGRLVGKSLRQDEVAAVGLRVGRGPVGRRRAGSVRLQRGRLQRLLPQHEHRLQDHVSPRHEHVLPSLQTLLSKRAEISAVHYPKDLSSPYLRTRSTSPQIESPFFLSLNIEH